MKGPVSLSVFCDVTFESRQKKNVLDDCKETKCSQAATMHCKCIKLIFLNVP